jgi:hypothetical protein
MFRFTIRDVLWLITGIGIGLAIAQWYGNPRLVDAEHRASLLGQRANLLQA